MKLRNKKTGEIGRLYFDHQLIDPKTGTYAIVIQHRDKLGYEAFANYFTLAKLNEEWEDYAPKEPKLEGEVREIVRHWANLQGYSHLRVGFDEREGQRIFWAESAGIGNRIEFLGAYVADDFDAGFYTITELCGEEE